MTATDLSATDLVAAVPGLAPYLRPATLLHPDAAPPHPGASRIGGPAEWPAGEPWPHCTARHPDDDHGYPRRAPEETPATSFVPLALIHAEDAPHLPWPDGTDLLQVLWCPNDHDDLQGERYYYGPAVELHWQHAAALAPATPPPPLRSDEEYLPRPCALRPEQVLDLPDRDELPEELARAVAEFAERQGIEYERDHGRADGWKLGGWPSWHVTDLIPVDCGRCGERMTHLLTVESGDGPDLSVGRHGELHVFVCPVDVAHPVGLDVQ
ncbi:DUF1963 domain-containing protein [Streptomyces sp. CBMA123]|uniref:DUF1963 domain-containing protein n=1 Tax=Streptomyces sp. CBMA123 TaxID=1896313 RepID=UPI001661D00C|nr:DUF1963 domain-containing protein [Streptomyces sp. CBMA123]MBD0691238.1 hypothetical protein [Streptomyces sp. CBMA123]